MTLGNLLNMAAPHPQLEDDLSHLQGYWELDVCKVFSTMPVIAINLSMLAVITNSSSGVQTA